MATFKAIILRGINDAKSDGTTNIKIRITHLRKINYISTDLFVIPKQFDNKQGIVTSGPNKKFINLRITDYLRKYREKDIKLGDNTDIMTVSEIKEFIRIGKTSNTQIDFFEFILEFVKTSKLKESTTIQYTLLAGSLQRFIGNKLPVSEITVNFLNRYAKWLTENGVKNGLINYMITFRSLFNKCRDQYNDEDTGRILIPNYPFRKFIIPTRNSNSNNHVLSIKQMISYVKYSPVSKGDEFAKDMFLLMFYLIGIEAIDLFHLKKPVGNRIVYDRFKTGKRFSIKLEPEAIEIIEKYQGEELLINVSEHYKHHKPFFQYINRHIGGKAFANIPGTFPKLNFPHEVTTKWARHSWATIARNDCRISKDDVALCLGHEDLDNKVTDMYIKYDYTIIDESNRKVLDLLLT